MKYGKRLIIRFPEDLKVFIQECPNDHLGLTLNIFMEWSNFLSGLLQQNPIWENAKPKDFMNFFEDTQECLNVDLGLTLMFLAR